MIYNRLDAFRTSNCFPAMEYSVLKYVCSTTQYDNMTRARRGVYSSSLNNANWTIFKTRRGRLTGRIFKQ